MFTDNINFNQTLISSITQVQPFTISRYITNNKIASIESSDKRKKYSFDNTRCIAKQFVANKFLSKNKIQTFFNFKGGTGKTSLCYQTSFLFSLLGFKVLVLDCDPQAHLSYSYGIREDKDFYTLYDVIINGISINEGIIKLGEGLDIIPSNLSLTRIESPLSQMANREKVLKRYIDKVEKQYDFIFIDTNPTISVLNNNATYVSDMLNIVCETQYYSLKGLQIVIQEIASFAEAMEKEMEYSIIPNKYEAKTVISQEVLGVLRSEYGNNVMGAVVRKCEEINQSARQCLPAVGFCKKRSVALEDLMDLTMEMIKRSCVEQKKQGELSDVIR